MPQPNNVREGHTGEEYESEGLDPMLECTNNNPQKWNAEYEEEEGQNFDQREERDYESYPEYWGGDYDGDLVETASQF